MKITAPGVYTLSDTEYHADQVLGVPSLSSTGARKIMAECPARFWADRQNPPEPSNALDVGRAAHEWLLEGATWPQKFVVLPADHNGRTNLGKQLVADIIDAGKRPLDYDDFEAIKAMRAALLEHPFASQAFQDGAAEQSLYWRDTEFGIWCRCRPDFMPRGIRIVPDYKTTRSAHPEYLRRAMYQFGYHQQADWYLAGINALGLVDGPRFLFVFQEKTPPYIVTCVTPDDDALRWAAMQNRKAREIFARCVETGVWPDYSDDIVTLGLPGWAMHQLQQQSDLGAFDVAEAAMTE